MKDNLSTYQVTLIVNPIKKIGYFSGEIVKVMTDEFSCVVIDSDSVNNGSSSTLSKELSIRTSNQSKLKVGIIDLQNGSDAHQKLTDLLEFFLKYSFRIRGKSIIFLINGKGEDLETFLRFAWSNDFLDLTVIEWTQASQKKTLRSTTISSPKIFFHTFNPFNNKYIRDILTSETDILPNKLINLEGYRLQAEVHEFTNSVDFCNGYTGSDGWEKVEGHDVEVTKLLMEAVNFTAVPQIVKAYVRGDMAPFNENVLTNDSSKQPIDFYSNLVRFNTSDITGRIDSINILFRKLSAQYIPFSTLRKIELMIYQRRVTETEISLSFIATVNVFLAIGFIFITFSRIFNLDRKTWSIRNVAKTLLGGSMVSRNQMKLSEKIFMLNLYAVSFIVMTLAQDELLKIVFSQKHLLKFKTLQDIVDAGVNLRVNSVTREHLSIYGEYHPTLRKIAEKSIVTESFDPYSGSGLNAEVHGAIYGWLGSNIMGVVPNVFNHDNTWFLTSIEEDVIVYLPVMIVRKNLPYRNRFRAVFQKVLETGLMHRYARVVMHHRFRNELINSNSSKEIHLHNNHANDKIEEIPLRNRLIIIVCVGYMISAAILMYEVILQDNKFFALLNLKLRLVKRWK
ncbi:hypothetical protein QAD02_011727 [Eretmocerus hayati]|uniref:Uncharacterized protein n=1 Tax=Eretmocerus hayati TaxID=131215 RepID=A0ACC2NZD8_9HYME|nr:hypothetical protein QAD02_011727 [Eretmocerus hayati]